MTKAIIVNIGDELLAGKTANTNASYMAALLNDHGIGVVRIETVSDDAQAIYNSISDSFSEVDLVIMTGGLGPTHDDITKVVIADYFNREMYLDEITYNRIAKYFKSRNKDMSDSQRLQSMMPAGTTVLANEVGTAPGMMLKQEGKILFSVPGVPSEMKYLMLNEVLPQIEKTFELSKKNQLTIRTACVSELVLEGILKETIDGLPKGTKLAFLPSLGEVKVRISQEATPENTKEKFDQITDKVKSLLEQHTYTTDNISIEQKLGKLLLENGKKLMTAESCSGGYLAQRIVTIPGSSAYYTGGIIPYQNELKTKWLDVNPATIEKHGAVSEEVVLEMLDGILKYDNVDIGISISGIAGPSGGSEEKPVGTIWVAWGDKSQKHTKKLQLWNHRKKNIHFSSTFCLNVLIKFLKTY